MNAIVSKPRDYTLPYLLAIQNPLPELFQTFQEELKILSNYCRDKIVLDVKAGAGRPGIDLAPLCKELICIDTSKKLAKLTKEKLDGIENVKVLEMDGIQMAFKSNRFDVVFATYNLIGSIPEQKELVEEMTRITKKGGKVLIFYWKNNDTTTEFLKKYYPSIGIEIAQITPRQTVTSYGVFERPTIDYVEGLMKKSGIKRVETISSGPVWNVSIGEK